MSRHVSGTASNVNGDGAAGNAGRGIDRRRAHWRIFGGLPLSAARDGALTAPQLNGPLAGTVTGNVTGNVTAMFPGLLRM